MVYFLCKAYDSDRQNCYFAQSLPVRGAWIEISIAAAFGFVSSSLPVRGAWIEMRRRDAKEDSRMSLPVRGAWIEIAGIRSMVIFAAVAPRAGSVD